MKIAPSCILAAASVLLTAAAPAAPGGAGIVAHGNGHGAAACSSCHGADLHGNSMMGAPAIAGLPEAVVLERLAHYAGPDGRNPMMRQVATSLSDGERKAVALYISHLAPAKR